MSLRLRLILAFFLLSVLPLGAVTLFTYANNAQAMREAAGREAELLADELSQRMQLVTAQLSERVGHLMDLEELRMASADAVAAQAALARAETAAPAVATAGTATQAAIAADTETQVAQALGDMAMLLNNVELRGMRGPRPPPPPGADPVGRGPSERGDADASGRASRPDDSAGRGRGSRGRGFVPGAGRSGGDGPPREPGAIPPVPAPPEAVGPPAVAPVAGTPDAAAVPPPPPPAPEPGAPPASAADRPAGRGNAAGSEPDRIMIDIGPIRRDLVRQFVPDGKWESLSDEERRRIIGEVNQRMMGIAQGIQMGTAEASRRAEEAQRAAAAKAKAVIGTPRPAPAAAPAAPTRRRTAISGNTLGVTVERDGQVIRAVNADMNIPNVLATIFATTRRDRGEIPFAVGPDGRVYTPTEAERTRIESIGGDILAPATPPGTTRINDWVVVSTADPTGSGLRFGIARAVGDSLGDLRRSSARNAAVGLGFIGLALIGIVPISSRLTSKLTRLSEGVRRIAQGDYSARVDIDSKDEVGRLATAFNQMAGDVEFHQRSAVERERIRRELELGRQIQHDMLPQSPLRLGATEVAGVSVPAREVGGDFFNYFALDDGRVALIMGDVSGKGVGAALLMANIQASLRTRLSLGQGPQAVATAIDRDIEQSARGALYATLVVGILDPVTRELRYVNAGHNPQYVLRVDGTLDHMESSGLPVGLIAGRGYREASLMLSPGDRLFYYTDGCVESENADGEMFGPERLEQLLRSSSQAIDLLVRVQTEVAAFRGAREPFDDATMMVVRIG